MKVVIIGAGYVGLTTGVCLSELGHNVVCVDKDPHRLHLLMKGKSPIYEPGLEELMVKNITSGRLTFADKLEEVIKGSQVIFICVNTPPREDGRADLRFVEKAAKEIALHMDGTYKVIVDKSTVPVKTAERVEETVKRYSNDESKFDVISNPEFLKEGTALKDTMEPDRIVLGSDSQAATDVMMELYKPIIDKTKAPVKVVSVRSAELIKHGANTFLALKISYANLIAQTCEETGADALEVLDAIGLDERIGKHFLNPGIGYGGSCFPKDIAAYKKTLDILGLDYSLVDAIERINGWAWKRFVRKIERELWILDGKVIAVLGLAFKSNTDDIRNAPAFEIIRELKSQGAQIKVYDPQAMKNTEAEFPDLDYCEDAYQATEGAEALLVCTDWEEFKGMDLKKIKENMTIPLIFDGRNVFDAKKAVKLGFKYFGVGR
jgi:UDPglucose 6-dehydrogenase